MSLEVEDRLRQTQTPRPARMPSPLSELQSSGDIRILIIDDDPATCAVIQAALSNRDFEIETVSEPTLVESMLTRKSPFHLIIMDYVIPGLEPEQVFTWIRDNQPEANIVVVTGYPSVDSALSCLRARTPRGPPRIPRAATRWASTTGTSRGSFTSASSWACRAASSRGIP